MTELKAYACLEPYEYTGAVIFAKSNIEARRLSADEFHDGEIGGMSVKRAHWADKYGSRSKVPISVMVDHGWHFECAWSGIRIDSDIYYWDETLKGKEPIGFQEGLVFACQEYADKFYEEERKRKEFEEEAIKLYRGMVLKRLPDAILIDGQGYGKREHIYTQLVRGTELRIIEQVIIPFEFPGMKYNAALEMRREHYNYSNIGPMRPGFFVANGDKEAFEAWAEEQLKVIKNEN